MISHNRQLSAYLGNRLRQARLARSLKLGDASEKANVAERTLRMLEAPDGGHLPQLRLLSRLANAYAIPVTALLPRPRQAPFAWERLATRLGLAYDRALALRDALDATKPAEMATDEEAYEALRQLASTVGATDGADPDPELG
ncbi:MAG: helix-turn-helix transcriptional regulator [Chloroflexota bacterium]